MSDIVKIGTPNTAIQQSGGFGSGFDSNLFKLKPQKVDLIQRSTNIEGAQPGKLRTTAGDHYDEMKIVLLRVNQGRVYFPPGGDLGADPICRSSDGITPADNAKVPQASNCAGCEQSSWKKWQKTKRTEDLPPCKEKINLFFVERETKLPYYLNLGGTSIKPTKELLSAIANKAAVLRSEGQNPNLFDFSFIIKPVKMDGAKGTFYVATFREIKVIRPEDREEFGVLFTNYVVNNQHSDEIGEAESAIEGALKTEGTTQEA